MTEQQPKDHFIFGSNFCIRRWRSAREIRIIGPTFHQMLSSSLPKFFSPSGAHDPSKIPRGILLPPNMINLSATITGLTGLMSGENSPSKLWHDGKAQKPLGKTFLDNAKWANNGLSCSLINQRGQQSKWNVTQHPIFGWEWWRGEGVITKPSLHLFNEKKLL